MSMNCTQLKNCLHIFLVENGYTDPHTIESALKIYRKEFPGDTSCCLDAEDEYLHLANILYRDFHIFEDDAHFKKSMKEFEK